MLIDLPLKTHAVAETNSLVRVLDGVLCARNAEPVIRHDSCLHRSIPANLLSQIPAILEGEIRADQLIMAQKTVSHHRSTRLLDLEELLFLGWLNQCSRWICRFKVLKGSLDMGPVFKASPFSVARSSGLKVVFTSRSSSTRLSA